MREWAAYILGERLPLLLVLLFLSVFIFVYQASQDFLIGARLFPAYIAVAGILVAIVELFRIVVLRKSDLPDFSDLSPEQDEDQDVLEAYGRAAGLFLWVAAYYLIMWVIGFLAATAVFVFGLLRIRFRTSWLAAAGVTAVTLAVAYILTTVLQLRWPAALLL